MAESKDKKLIYIAILLGLFAFILNFAYVSSLKKKYTNEYVVARRDIQYGKTVTEDDLETITVPSSVHSLMQQRYLVKSRFPSPEKGRIAQRDILRGEFISNDALGLGTLDLEPASLGPDETFVSITVDEKSSIGYRLFRGCRIDIYDANAGLVLSNAEVAAVGAETDRSRSSGTTSYRSITLRVKTDEAKDILRAGDVFKITLKRTE
jgi:Flp pilus assembly protein CpaB